MNAREAREIAKPGLIIGYKNIDDLERGRHLGRAEGFLEAVEKFRPVVEALEKISNKFDVICSVCFEQKCDEDCSRKIAKEVIKSYRRDVLGEE